MDITSRAALLRALNLPGIQIEVISHWQPHLVSTTRTPKATRNNGRPGVQTNGYWFDGPTREGKIVEMWADIPPASRLSFNPDGTVTFYPTESHNWTLKFNAQPEPSAPAQQELTTHDQPPSN